MKYQIKWHWLFLIALLSLGFWYSRSQRGGSSVPETARSYSRHVEASETRKSSTKEVREPRSDRPAAAAPLKGVQSPLARRYLSFLLPGSWLDGESYADSIVNNAFSQAWGVTARLDLSEEQQDRLAEFLLREDWRGWAEMDPERIREWAREHLSEEQQTALQAFIKESKQGQLALMRMREEGKMKEHGVQSPEEAFAAEMDELQKISELLAGDTEGLDAKELEKKRSELKELMRKRVRGEGDETQNRIAESMKDEQDARFYNLLADRIPLTEEQRTAVYNALHQGARAPINPYDYQSRPPERVENDVRAATDWMNTILTEHQYETYVRQFLAQIEMIRFQKGRR